MLLHLRPPPSGATRLDHTTPDDPVEFVRDLAAAIDALDDAGIKVAGITRTGVWLDDRGDAFLDGGDAARPGESPAAELARLLQELAPRTARRHAFAVTRALDGAYLSAGQFAVDLAVSKRHSWLAGVLNR